MVVKLTKISMMPLAGILTCVHAIIGLIVGGIITVGSLGDTQAEGLWALGAWAIVVLPLVNGLLGFLTGVFISGCYNLVVQWFGGIEVEFEQQDAIPSFKRINV